MDYNTTTNLKSPTSDTEVAEDPRLTKIKAHKESAEAFKQRRLAEWNENYMLYRDRVVVNRLTQRQSVNVPLMKYLLKTNLSNIDDPPMLHFQNMDNDAQKELYYNETWKVFAKQNKLVLKDIVDKKKVLLFGRSFKKLNIVSGKFAFNVRDPLYMLVDRYVDPTDINSARFVAETGIFKALASLDKDPSFDKAAIARLKTFYDTEAGIIKANNNILAVQAQDQRKADLGELDAFNPKVGETYVELNENYLFEWDEKKGREVIWVTVTADDAEVLSSRCLYEVIGNTKDGYWCDHYPYVSWADDVEEDFWSDGIGDSIRTPNKIVNSWISQLVENRTLRNFGMNYYDSSGEEEFIPQTFDAVPFGWYPIPGDPNKMIMRVDVPDLGDSIGEMEYVVGLAEKAAAASATTQGATEQQKITLGEVQLALANAKERVKSMAIYYNDSWEEFGTKYIKMLEAADKNLDKIEIVRPGRNNKQLWRQEVGPSDWATTTGYTVEVKMLGDRDAELTDQIQKLEVAKTLMPNNAALTEIVEKKVLDFAGLKADEVQKVLDEQKQALEQAQQAAAEQGGAPQAPGAQGTVKSGSGGTKESVQINYRDAPPDIQRQMEQAAGFKPSQIGTQPQQPPANGQAPTNGLQNGQAQPVMAG